MNKNNSKKAMVYRCPTCATPVLITVGGATEQKTIGYTRARASVLEKMKTYCTPEEHRKRALVMRYCNLCHKSIEP